MNVVLKSPSLSRRYGYFYTRDRVWVGGATNKPSDRLEQQKKRRLFRTSSKMDHCHSYWNKVGKDVLDKDESIEMCKATNHKDEEQRSTASILQKKRKISNDEDGNDSFESKGGDGKKKASIDDNVSKTLLLAQPQDSESLSDRQCYVRQKLVELFTATKDDVKVRHSRGAQKLYVGQIGIRCIHCTRKMTNSSSKTKRSERSVCYPSSLSRMYQTVADMQRFHFETCSNIPPEDMSYYKSLKTTRPRGMGSPQDYWVESAKALGLFDSSNGIRLIAPSNENEEDAQEIATSTSRSHTAETDELKRNVHNDEYYDVNPSRNVQRTKHYFESPKRIQKHFFHGVVDDHIAGSPIQSTSVLFEQSLPPPALSPPQHVSLKPPIYAYPAFSSSHHYEELLEDDYYSNNYKSRHHRHHPFYGDEPQSLYHRDDSSNKQHYRYSDDPSLHYECNWVPVISPSRPTYSRGSRRILQSVRGRRRSTSNTSHFGKHLPPPPPPPPTTLAQLPSPSILYDNDASKICSFKRLKNPTQRPNNDIFDRTQNKRSHHRKDNAKQINEDVAKTNGKIISKDLEGNEQSYCSPENNEHVLASSCSSSALQPNATSISSSKKEDSENNTKNEAALLLLLSRSGSTSSNSGQVAS